MAFAPFLHGMPGPIVRPPSVPQPILNGSGNRFNPTQPGIGTGFGPLQPQQPVTGGFGPQPLSGLGGIQSPIMGQQPQIGQAGQFDPRMQSPIQQQQRPIASYDNLKHVHTIKKSGLYRLKKGEKIIPLSSLAHSQS